MLRIGIRVRVVRVRIRVRIGVRITSSSKSRASEEKHRAGVFIVGPEGACRVGVFIVGRKCEGMGGCVGFRRSRPRNPSDIDTSESNIARVKRARVRCNFE